MNSTEHLREIIILKWKAMDGRAAPTGAESWEELAPYCVRGFRGDEEVKREVNKRIEKVSEYLRSRGLLREEHTVIDVGCGSGRFALEFAKTAKHVTGMDVSPTVCAAARERADELGLKNVDFITADFDAFDPEKEGALKKYDLVFSSLLPMAEVYGNFRKLEAMSRGSCFIAYPTELIKPLFQELALKAAGDSLGKPPSRILRLMMSFNVLCLEGKRPEVFFFEANSSVRIPVNETALVSITSLWPAHGFTEEEKKKLLSLLKEAAAPDGTVTSDVKSVVGCLFWEAGGGQRS